MLITSSGGLSSYFIRGAVDTFSITKKILDQLLEITPSDQLESVSLLVDLQKPIGDFYKYDYVDHLDTSITGSNDAMHCAHHAVNGICSHIHESTCDDCKLA